MATKQQADPFETAARRRFVEEHNGDGVFITWLGMMGNVVHVQYNDKQRGTTYVRYPFSELQKYVLQ